MPVDFIESLTRFQEESLAAIKQAQDANLAAFSSLTEIASKSTAAMPNFPKFEGMPNPAQVIESTFGFAEKFLELRKEYALKIAELTAKN